MRIAILVVLAASTLCFVTAAVIALVSGDDVIPVLGVAVGSLGGFLLMFRALPLRRSREGGREE